MTTKMEMLDPSALSDATSAVTYDPKSETVTLPGGLVSVAGITMVTGGIELSCGSCLLAFGFWGTLIGFSCVAAALWAQLKYSKGGTSHLLGLGFVILALSFVVVGSVGAFYLLKGLQVNRTETINRNQRGEERSRGLRVGHVLVPPPAYLRYVRYFDRYPAWSYITQVT